MKSIIIILNLVVASNFCLYAQCPSLNVILNGQSEVDNFVATYPDCFEVDNLELTGDIADVSFLKRFKRIGSFFVNGINVDTIAFDSLNSFSVRIQYCPNLKTITIDHNTNVFLSDYIIRSNPELTSLKIPEEELRSISILTDTILAVNFVADTVMINHAVGWSGDVILNADNIKVKNQIIYGGSNIYRSFDDLLNIFSFDNALTFSVGFQDSFNISGIEKIPAFNELGFGSINKLELTGLETVDLEIAAGFAISLCPSVDSLEFYVKSQSVFIQDMEALKYINGFSDSDLYSTHVNLIRNPVLESIDFLSNFESIDYLRIEDNPLVSFCSYDPVCELIENSDNTMTVFIQGNNVDCLDVPSVSALCMTSIDEISTQKKYSQGIAFFNHELPEFLNSYYPNCSELVVTNISGNQNVFSYGELVKTVLLPGSYIVRCLDSEDASYVVVLE